MVVAAGLLGCSVVDQYSSRAVVYNLEAEKAQEQAMLLNIVRAYLGRPMQFTTVSTITGTASAGGNAGYTLPTNLPALPLGTLANGWPPVPTWTFGGSLSGGPAFTVPVLDTQEFYRGILTAIPGKIWDLYIQAGYPRDLLFNLFVEKVVMQRDGADCPSGHSVAQCEFVFSNHVAADIDIDLFQALGDYLLALGLTTEKTTDAPSVPFDNPASINVRFVGDPPAGKPHEAEVLGAPGGSGSDSLSASTTYVLCFAPLETKYAPLVQAALCGKKHDGKTRVSQALDGDQTNGGLPANRIRPSGSATVALEPSAVFITRLMGIATERGYRDLAERLAPFSHNRSVKITVYLRHTEGMIHYLGELVRRQAQDGRAIFVKLDPPYTTHDTTHTCVAADKRTGCAYIFHLNLGSEPGDVVSVFYDGSWFSLPPGSAEDLSSLSFDFLKQQLALNSSAKSLPQSSVLTTVGP